MLISKSNIPTQFKTFIGNGFASLSHTKTSPKTKTATPPNINTQLSSNGVPPKHAKQHNNYTHLKFHPHPSILTAVWLPLMKTQIKHFPSSSPLVFHNFSAAIGHGDGSIWNRKPRFHLQNLPLLTFLLPMVCCCS